MQLNVSLNFTVSLQQLHILLSTVIVPSGNNIDKVSFNAMVVEHEIKTIDVFMMSSIRIVLV